jgi:hypothetical protein
VAVVISLNLFMAPVDDTVTAQHKSQVTSHNHDWLYLCHTSSVRNTSDSRGPVTRKSSG